MSMRKHLRYRAHATMKELGLAHVNRTPKIGRDRRSFFARNWRKYISVEAVRNAKKKRQNNAAS